MRKWGKAGMAVWAEQLPSLPVFPHCVSVWWWGMSFSHHLLLLSKHDVSDLSVSIHLSISSHNF